MGGGTAVAHPPVPAALSRLRSDESKSTVDSPMSTSSAGPSGQAEPPRPATHLPPASGGADGPAGDSSDEEGAHRPPLTQEAAARASSAASAAIRTANDAACAGAEALQCSTAPRCRRGAPHDARE